MAFVAILTASVGSVQFDEGDFTYTVTDAVNFECEVASYNDHAAEVVVPSTVTYKGKTLTVVSIGESAFEDNEEIIKVILPNTVKEIGKLAFHNCKSLSTVDMLAVKTIRYKAFESCTSLSNIKMPAVETIDDDAFLGCTSLSYIDVFAVKDDIFIGGNNTEIYGGVKNIGEYAFAGCKSLKEIEIPQSVKTIGSNAFSGVELKKLIIRSSEQELDISSSSEYGSSFNGCSCDYFFLGRNFKGSKYEPTEIPKGLIITNKITIGSLVDKLAFIETPTFKNFKINYGESPCIIPSDYLFGTAPNDTVYFERNCKGDNSFYFAKEANTNVVVIGNYISRFTVEFEPQNEINSLILGKKLGHIYDISATIKVIYSYNPTPPSIGRINKNNYINTVVYVPKGSLEAYQTADIWKNFWEIKEMETSGIENTSIETQRDDAVYNLSGQRLEKPQKGINIIKGKKIYVK